MADVTEVIHKITYEVNNDALDGATRAVQMQLIQLQKLTRQIAIYSNQLTNAGSASDKHFKQLQTNIKGVNDLLLTETKKTEGILANIYRGIAKGFDMPDNIKNGIADYIVNVRKEFAKLSRDADGVSSGLNGKLKYSLGNLVTSLTSVNGLLKLGIGFFADLAVEAYNAGIKTDQVATKLQEIDTRLDETETSILEDASKQIARIEFLSSVVNDESKSMEVRLGAIKKLKEEFPEYFGNLETEAIKYNDIKEAVDGATGAILKRASAQAAYKKFEEVSAAEFDAGQKEKELKSGIADITKDAKPEDVQKFLDSRKTDEDGFDGWGYSLRLQSKGVDVQLLAKYTDELEETVELRKQLQTKRIELLEEAKKLTVVVDGLQDRDDKTRKDGNGINRSTVVQVKSKRNTEQPLPELKTSDTKEIPTSIRGLNTKDLAAGEEVDLPQTENKADKMSLKERLDPFKKMTEEQRKQISSQVEDYAKLAQAAADAYNKILQVQIDTLDKEISLREKRVEEAKKLAERGNTEALRIEEERLRKAQQQRENFARRQQAVNAAITVSNAIAAVARAALEGGGFGSVATIAALIAALAAGYAAVTSLSNDGGDAFADGVIDYRGKGGPRDDKNWVRISTGESIITAEGTKKHRALLEAINTGARLQLSDAALPFVMPAFKQPGIVQGQYASANDMQRLETKLDEVVDAIEGNKLKQDIFFNEQGVGIMTERAIQRDRRRWK